MITKEIKAFLTVLIVLTGSFSAFSQKTLDKSFSGIDAIDMSVGSGDAVFKKSSGKEVTVKLSHTYNFDYNPTVEKRGSTLYIDEDEVNNRNRSYSGSATWTFEIPDGLEIEFNTGSGDFDIAGLSVDLDMNSGSGDFSSGETDGTFNLKTGSGDFRIENSKGDFMVKTGSGEIDAREIEGKLKLKTGSGDIELSNVVAEISGSTGSGDISGNGIKLDGISSFKTGSGDVEIELTESPQFSITASTGSGDAVIDFGGNKIEGLIVMKANKRNGEIVAPFDFDSVEEIDNGRNNVTIKKTKKFGSKDIQIKISSGSGTAEISK